MPKLIIKKLFGALALLAGVAFIWWIVHNHFHPEPDYHGDVISLGLMTIACFVVGWRWIRFEPPT